MTSPRPSNFLIEPTGEHRAVVSESTEVVGYVQWARSTAEENDIPSNVPADELWLWRNRRASQMVDRGLEQAASGDGHDLGSFAQYRDLEIID